MPAIYLIRHGQASFGQENYDQLSELGTRQAQRLGEALRERIHQFDLICTGSMLRHQQTAEYCLNRFGQNICQKDWLEDAGWNEYDHQNILAGMGAEFTTAACVSAWVKKQPDSKQALRTLFDQAMARWMSGAHDPDYMESWQHFQNRVKHALRSLVEHHRKAKNIAVFTSGRPISLTCQQLLGIPSEQLMRMNWTLVNCGISKLVVSGEKRFVSSLNEHGHFEKDHKQFITYR
jgi:broad specificity phosphatase PhoE